MSHRDPPALVVRGCEGTSHELAHVRRPGFACDASVFVNDIVVVAALVNGNDIAKVIDAAVEDRRPGGEVFVDF